MGPEPKQRDLECSSFSKMGRLCVRTHKIALLSSTQRRTRDASQLTLKKRFTVFPQKKNLKRVLLPEDQMEVEPKLQVQIKGNEDGNQNPWEKKAKGWRRNQKGMPRIPPKKDTKAPMTLSQWLKERSSKPETEIPRAVMDKLKQKISTKDWTSIMKEAKFLRELRQSFSHWWSKYIMARERVSLP